MRRIGVALGLMLCTTTAVSAHYSMLLPDRPWAEKGEKVTFTYQYGHPYEHELSEAPRPIAVRAFPPRGGEMVLDKELTSIKKDGADGKKVTAWQFTFTPMERGDYTLVLRTAQIKHDDALLVQDTVRVVLHVQTQNGWERRQRWFTTGMDIWPETRPYGLLPGMVFKGKVVHMGEFDNVKLVAGLPVEIEKYNATPPKKLPPDELITFKTRVDATAYFITTLPEPGWWGLTARTESMGKDVIQERATTWIHVDEKK